MQKKSKKVKKYKFEDVMLHESERHRGRLCTASPCIISALIIVTMIIAANTSAPAYHIQ